MTPRPSDAQIEARLFDYLADALDEVTRREFEQFLAESPAWRDRLERERALDAALRRVEPRTLGAEGVAALKSRVRERVRLGTTSTSYEVARVMEVPAAALAAEERRARRRGGRRLGAWALAAAVVVATLVVALPMLDRFPLRRPGQGAPLVATETSGAAGAVWRASEKLAGVRTQGRDEAAQDAPVQDWEFEPRPTGGAAQRSLAGGAAEAQAPALRVADDKDSVRGALRQAPELERTRPALRARPADRAESDAPALKADEEAKREVAAPASARRGRTPPDDPAARRKETAGGAAEVAAAPGMAGEARDAGPADASPMMAEAAAAPAALAVPDGLDSASPFAPPMAPGEMAAASATEVAAPFADADFSGSVGVPREEAPVVLSAAPAPSEAPAHEAAVMALLASPIDVVEELTPPQREALDLLEQALLEQGVVVITKEVVPAEGAEDLGVVRAGADEFRRAGGAPRVRWIVQGREHEVEAALLEGSPEPMMANAMAPMAPASPVSGAAMTSWSGEMYEQTRAVRRRLEEPRMAAQMAYPPSPSPYGATVRGEVEGAGREGAAPRNLSETLPSLTVRMTRAPLATPQTGRALLGDALGAAGAGESSYDVGPEALRADEGAAPEEEDAAAAAAAEARRLADPSAFPSSFVLTIDFAF